MSNMLAIGRVVGLDNLAQMKGLARGITQGPDGVYTARLNFTTKDLRDFNNAIINELPVDAFQKEQMTTQQNMSHALAEAFFPRAMADNVKNSIDIVVKKVHDTIKGFGIKAVSKDEQGEICNTMIRADLDDILGNKLALNSKSADTNIDANIEINNSTDLYNLMKNLKYSTEGSKGIVTTQYGDSFVRAEVPADYMEYASRIQAGKSVEEYVADLQKSADALI